MVRGRLAVVLGLLASGVAWGTALPGAIEGYVTGGGQPLNGQLVRLMQGTVLQGTTTTNAAGFFEFRPVGAGAYRVGVQVQPAESWDDPPQQEPTVAPGQTVTLDFDALPNGAEPTPPSHGIWGRVTDECSGAGIPSCEVTAHGDWNHQATTDANGWYSIPDASDGW